MIRLHLLKDESSFWHSLGDRLTRSSQRQVSMPSESFVFVHIC
jgi:hypothetical protein